jgi:hypothetical protein
LEVPGARTDIHFSRHYDGFCGGVGGKKKVAVGTIKALQKTFGAGAIDFEDCPIAVGSAADQSGTIQIARGIFDQSGIGVLSVGDPGKVIEHRKCLGVGDGDGERNPQQQGHHQHMSVRAEL